MITVVNGAGVLLQQYMSAPLADDVSTVCWQLSGDMLRMPLFCLQISSPEDTHNFYAAPDAPGAHQVKHKYVSTGVFKDF